MAELTAWAGPLWLGWTLLAVAALLAGFSKTAINGVSMITVVLAALVFPAKDSTGMVLVLFLVGDLVAIWTYRRTVDWRLIGRLVVPVLVGIALGAVFLAAVDDVVLKRTIGVILLVLLVLGLLPGGAGADHRLVGAGYGGLSGFTTMVANAGGPAMSLYLLAVRFDKWRFLGTAAWFFFAVNLTKVPVAIGLGNLRWDNALVSLALAPVVLLGTWLGRLTVARIEQRVFERLVTMFVAASAVYLLVG